MEGELVRDGDLDDVADWEIVRVCVEDWEMVRDGVLVNEMVPDDVLEKDTVRDVVLEEEPVLDTEGVRDSDLEGLRVLLGVLEADTTCAPRTPLRFAASWLT